MKRFINRERELDALSRQYTAEGASFMGNICADIGVKQTIIPKYLKTLIDLDILEREDLLLLPKV